MHGRSGNADLTWVGPLASLHASSYRTPILGILPSGKLAPGILCLIFHCAIRDVESKFYFPSFEIVLDGKAAPLATRPYGLPFTSAISFFPSFTRAWHMSTIGC